MQLTKVWMNIFCTAMLFTINVVYAQNVVYSCRYSNFYSVGWNEMLFTPQEVVGALDEVEGCVPRNYGISHCGCSNTVGGMLADGLIRRYGLIHNENGINAAYSYNCNPPGRNYDTVAPPVQGEGPISCYPINPGNWRLRLYGATETQPSFVPRAVPARKESYHILVDLDGVPQANKNVEISLTSTPDSGAHLDSGHSQPRPIGTLSRTTGTTDVEGKFKFTWTVPQASGYYTLTYKCLTCNNFISTKTLTVTINDLIQLRNNEVVGQNNTSIYARTMEDTRHAQDLDGVPSSYWITQSSKNKLLNIISFMSNNN